jgi:hypothetical protein
VSYTTFIDGVQTVLLFSDDTKIIEAASGVCIETFPFHRQEKYRFVINIDPIIS